MSEELNNPTPAKTTDENPEFQAFVNDMVKAAVGERSNVSEATLVSHLRSRYSGNSYAFFSQVRDSTGYGASRTADAIVMGLWSSRGLELEGFEIKISRTDWQKELKTPQKAEAICQYCDRWWMVVSDEKIVHEGELPPTWGLMVLRKGKLIVKVQAPKLKPSPMDRGFIASLLRKASEEMAGMILKTEIRDELADQYKVGFERGKSSVVLGHEAQELAMLKKSLEEFKKKSGIEINSWNGPAIGAVVKAVQDMGPDRVVSTLKGYKENMARLLAGAEDGLKRIEKEIKELRR